jgi:hypothetical protein
MLLSRGCMLPCRGRRDLIIVCRKGDHCSLERFASVSLLTNTHGGASDLARVLHLSKKHRASIDPAVAVQAAAAKTYLACLCPVHKSRKGHSRVLSGGNVRLQLGKHIGAGGSASERVRAERVSQEHPENKDDLQSS